jgi:hypothetical protein
LYNGNGHPKTCLNIYKKEGWMNKILLLAFVFALILVGCNAENSVTAVRVIELTATQPIITAPVEPQTIPTSELPTQDPAPTTAPVPSILEAEVNADNLNLRGGPSLIHNIISQYQKGEIVTLIARAPGSEWVKILAKNKKTGWMSVTHLTLKQDINLLPVFEINESLVIKGKVVDVNGNGIPGIQVAVTRLGGVDRVRVDGISLSDGTFFAYAPVEYQGPWLASVVGVGCESPIVDANCRYAGVFQPTGGVNLTLPAAEDVVITYQ